MTLRLLRLGILLLEQVIYILFLIKVQDIRGEKVGGSQPRFEGVNSDVSSDFSARGAKGLSVIIQLLNGLTIRKR